MQSRFPQPGYEVRLISTVGSRSLTCGARGDDSLIEVSARLEALAGSPLYWWIRVPHDTLLVENAREAGGNPEVTLYGPESQDRSRCYVCPYVFGAGHASALPAAPSLGNESLLLEQFDGAERIIYACSREFLIDHGVSQTDADVYVRRIENADMISRIQRCDDVLNGIELQDREFFAAIREGREPNSSIAQVLPCYQVLHDLEQQLT
jgi:hypothetical protein